MIIVEGPDGSGKTTFAKKLGIPTHMNMGNRQEDLFGLYVDIISNNPDAILDRGFYSEYPYGTVIRGDTLLSLQDIYNLETLMPEDSIVYYMTGDRDEMWERASLRGEEYVTSRDQYEKICDIYDDIFINSKRNVKVEVIS